MPYFTSRRSVESMSRRRIYGCDGMPVGFVPWEANFGAAGGYLRLNGGYRSVTSSSAYACTRTAQRPTPTTKSNSPLG